MGEPSPPSPPPPPWKEGCTQQELDLITLLRREVLEEMNTGGEQDTDDHDNHKITVNEQDLPPHFLIRFLRARSHSLPRAKTMLLNYFKWAAEHNYPACIHPDAWTPPPIIRDDIVYKFWGSDSEHRPIIFAPVGAWEVRKRLEEGLKEQLVLHVYSIFKTVMDRLEETRIAYGVTQVIGVLDMAQLSFSKLSLETLQATTRFFKEFEAYFPEIVSTVYVINAPMVFTFVYNLMAPFMSTVTIEKIRVYGCNAAEWKQVLKEKIPAECLPKEYGGD